MLGGESHARGGRGGPPPGGSCIKKISPLYPLIEEIYPHLKNVPSPYQSPIPYYYYSSIHTIYHIALATIRPFYLIV